MAIKTESHPTRPKMSSKFLNIFLSYPDNWRTNKNKKNSVTYSSGVCYWFLWRTWFSLGCVCLGKWLWKEFVVDIDMYIIKRWYVCGLMDHIGAWGKLYKLKSAAVQMGEISWLPHCWLCSTHITATVKMNICAPCLLMYAVSWNVESMLRTLVSMLGCAVAAKPLISVL